MSENTAMFSFSGKEITDIVQKINESCGDFDVNAVYIACMIVALCTQHPEMSNEKIRDGVLELSTFISGLNPTPVEGLSPTENKGKMN